MNRLQRWWAKRRRERFLAYLREEVRQGPQHPARIRQVYADIREVAHREFYEDNEVTLDDFLFELFTRELKSDRYRYGGTNCFQSMVETP